MFEGGQSHGQVGVIGGGNDDRMDIVAGYDVGVIRGHNRCPGLLSGILQGAWVGIAEGCHSNLRTEGKSG